MPPYLLHLLQPLDVGCFSPLKRAYNTEIMLLARKFIIHIAKINFLFAFKNAYTKIFTAKTIKKAFRDAGLILHNLDAAISKLNVRFCTLN